MVMQYKPNIASFHYSHAKYKSNLISASSYNPLNAGSVPVNVLPFFGALSERHYLSRGHLTASAISKR